MIEIIEDNSVINENNWRDTIAGLWTWGLSKGYNRSRKVGHRGFSPRIIESGKGDYRIQIGNKTYKIMHREAGHKARNSGHRRWYASRPCRSGECLVHVQITSLWYVHHPSGPERLWQRPQAQDHQPECHLHCSVQKPQDMSQVSYLDKQVYPGGNGLLTAAYQDAMTARAHSYVVIDINRTISPVQHLCKGAHLWTRIPALRNRGHCRWVAHRKEDLCHGT